MTTITTKNIKRIQNGMPSSPFGNAVALKYHFETNSSGVYVDSDLATAVQVDDIVRLGVLPAGLEVFDLQFIISDAFAGSTTMDVGFAYVDGVDVAATPQADTFFATDMAMSSTAVLRKTAVAAPITLPKDAYLTLTSEGAAQSGVGILDVIVWGVWHGSPSAVPS